MSSGGYESSQSSTMYPRYDSRRSSTNIPVQNYDRSFSHAPRRRSPSPGPSRRLSYDSYIPNRVEAPYQSEYPNVYRPNSYRPGYSPGSYYNRTPSPDRFPSYARSPDVEPWDRTNAWQPPLKASASWPERKPLPPSPIRERARRDDTIATRIFEPSDTWRRDHVDRPPLSVLDRHTIYRRDNSDNLQGRSSRFGRSSVIYPGGDRYRPGETHRDSFNTPRSDYDSYRPPYDTSWTSPPPRDPTPGSDHRKDAPISSHRSLNHYEPHPTRRLSGSIPAHESISPKSQIRSPVRHSHPVSPGQEMGRKSSSTDKLHENEQQRKGYSIMQHDGGNIVNSSFLSRPSSRSSIASTLHSEKANGAVLTFPSIQSETQTRETSERHFQTERIKQDASKSLSPPSHFLSPMALDSSKVFKSQDTTQILSPVHSRTQSNGFTMNDTADRVNQVIVKGEMDLHPDQQNQSQVSSILSLEHVGRSTSPSRITKISIDTINQRDTEDMPSFSKAVDTISVVPIQGQEGRPSQTSTVGKQEVTTEPDLSIDVTGEDPLYAPPTQDEASKTTPKPAQQKEESDELDPSDGHILPNRSTTDNDQKSVTPTPDISMVDVTPIADAPTRTTDGVKTLDTSTITSPTPRKHPITPEGSPKSDRDTLKHGLRLVVMTRLLCDRQTREERINPVLLANLALAQPADPEMNEATDADAVIRYIMTGSHSEKRTQRFKMLKPSLREYFVQRQAIISEKAQRLQKEYMELHEKWLAQCHALNDQAKPSILEGETVPIGRTTRRSANLGDAVRSDLEMEQILASLGVDDATDPNHLSQRNLATIPDMICVTKGKVDYVFDDTNHRVENPAEYYAPNTGIHDWTEEEKNIFLDKYAAYPKQFGVIAEFLPNKTAAQCVDYYYLHKKGLIDFRKVVSKFGPKRRRRGAGKRKGNALLTDIQRHDEEMHRGSGSPSAGPSQSSISRRGRKPKDKEKDNLDPKEGEKKLSGRAPSKRNAVQLEKTPTDTPTPEPEAKSRRRRGLIATRISAIPPSRTVSINHDEAEDDTLDPDPRPAKRAKRTRKIKSAAIVEDDSPTPEDDPTPLPVSTMPMDGKPSLLEQEKNFPPPYDGSAVHYLPQIHPYLYSERIHLPYDANGFTGNIFPLFNLDPPTFLHPPSHPVIHIPSPTPYPRGAQLGDSMGEVWPPHHATGGNYFWGASSQTNGINML